MTKLVTKVCEPGGSEEGKVKILLLVSEETITMYNIKYILIKGNMEIVSNTLIVNSLLSDFYD